MTQIPPTHIVRLFDMFDGWIDVFQGSYDDCLAHYNVKTKNGTYKTKYSDGDYWKIFPIDTQMLITPETLGR